MELPRKRCEGITPNRSAASDREGPTRAIAAFPAVIAVMLLISFGAVSHLDAAEKLSRRERKERIASLSETYLTFLDEVEPIMSPAELDVFLRMESDPQRDRFIEEFWRRRDPDPLTPLNEYRDGYYARRELAVTRYRSVNTDRGRILVVKGEPVEVFEIEHCRYLRPIEIWHYRTRTRSEFLVFFRPGGDYVLWQGMRHSSVPGREAGNGVNDALDELLNPTGQSVGVEAVFFDHFERRRIERPYVLQCENGEIILEAVFRTVERKMDVHEAFNPPPIDDEDVSRMLETSVIADPDATVLDVDSTVSFGEQRGSRVLVRLMAEIDRSLLTPITVGGDRYYQLDVVGETLREERMFERWQYRFEFPEAGSGQVLPVIVERPLRAGRWELRMKVRNPGSDAEAIITHVVDVPAAGRVTAPNPGEVAPERATNELRSVVRLLPPEGTILTGLHSFVAIPGGDEVAGVEFHLDGTRVMRKMAPPYSVELDLGPVPRPHVVRAVALNRKREPLDEDVLRINDGTDPFRVRIVSPRIGRNVTGLVRVEMEPQIPSDATLATLELYVDDVRVATLFDEPWIQTVVLPAEPRLTVFRAVATLEDPAVRPVEDVVILNGPENLERVDVRLIEVPVSVFVDGRPVQQLSADAFRIMEGGKPVEIAKFERLSNLPLSIGLAIDGSASMKSQLEGARNAASAFLGSVLTPRDRAFLVSFDRRVFTLADWTSDPQVITGGLASLRAEESTAMYDAVIESLYRFVGLEGRRALVLISDGADTASRYEWEATLEYARRMAVPIYAIGIGISPVQIEARSRLQALAANTGAQVWFISDVSELAEPYEQIERELRSQYLLGFYAPEDAEAGGEWREIVVIVEGADQVRAVPGYYP